MNWQPPIREGRRGDRLENPDKEEEGFTLIELLLVVVLLPLIMGAVAVAIITSLQDEGGISTKLADSVDSQVSSVYFGRDVQSATYMTTGQAATTTAWTSTQGPTVCGSGTTYILGLAWPNGSSQSVVSYWSQVLTSASDGVTNGTSTITAAPQSGFTGFSTADIGQAIVETDAKGAIPVGTTILGVSSSTTATLSTTTTGGSLNGVAFAIGPKLVREYCQGTTAAVSRTVSRDYFAPLTTASIACGSSAPTCTNNDGTQWVSTGGVASISLVVDAPTSQYNYVLTGTPRNTLPLTSSQKGKPPSLLLLGGGAVINQSNGTISVTGTATLNSGYFSQSNGNFSATSVYGTYSPESGACTVSGANCKNVSPSDSSWQTTSTVADPLAGLTDPSQPASKITSCPSGTATLSPGEYTCELQVGGTVTLNAGLYVFDQGIDISPGGVLNGLSGVLLYFPCNASVNNNQVDSWAPACGGVAGNTTETLTLESGASLETNPIASGPYQGLWLWQNLGDTLSISQKGPAANSSVTGYMYAPGSTVNIKAGTGQAQLGGIIAAGITMQNGTLTVNPQ